MSYIILYVLLTYLLTYLLLGCSGPEAGAWQ